MRVIAHRVFDDRGALIDLEHYGVDQVHGAELDVRRGEDGEIVVRHSPLFSVAPSHRRTGGAATRLTDAIRRLEAVRQPPKLLFLDIKCVTAAEAAARLVASAAPSFQVAFVCWRPEEVEAIRAVAPDAKIYFCCAPIFSRRLGRVLPADFYLYNSFPFVTHARRFAPKLRKTNRHNINVRLFSHLGGARALPEGVHGVCLHRIFFSRALAVFAKRAGLRVAVYGLSTPQDPRLERHEDVVDYAILRAPAAAKRRAEGRAGGWRLRRRPQATVADQA